jgi:hypothetical protein
MMHVSLYTVTLVKHRRYLTLCYILLFQKKPLNVSGATNILPKSLPHQANQKTDVAKLAHQKTDSPKSAKTKTPQLSENKMSPKGRNRPTPCPYCHKILSRTDGLRPHILSLHPGQKVPVRVTSSPVVANPGTSAPPPVAASPVRVKSSPVKQKKIGATKKEHVVKKDSSTTPKKMRPQQSNSGKSSY